MLVQWACPKCKARLKADSSISLRRIHCPKCQAETIVPKPETSTSAAPAPAAQASAEFDPYDTAPSAPASSPDEWLGGTAPAEPHWLAGGAAPVPVKRAVATGSASGILKKQKKSSLFSREKMPLLVTVGSIAACLLIGGVFLATGVLSSSDKTTEAPKPAPLPALVFDWPAADRVGAIVEIDGENYRIKENGPLQYDLPPGSHKVVLNRLGYGKLEFTFAPNKNGERMEYKPEWKVARPGDTILVDDTSGSTSIGAGDKLVTETYPTVFKKWETDFDKAQKAANHDKKDILIAFFSADRRDWCQALAAKLLTSRNFETLADQHLELVVEEAAGKTAPEGSEMAKLAARYHVTSYPTLVMTDADGLPYARREYIELNPASYLNMVTSYLNDRKKRDDLFAASEGASPDALTAAGKALEWLGEKNLVPYYVSKIHDWSKLADKVDPNNKSGTAEKFFLKELGIRLDMVDHTKPAELKPVVDFLEGWKKDHKFKDPDAAAKLHLKFAAMFGRGGDDEMAATLVQEALDCKPNDPEFRAYLQHLVEMIGGPVSSGSGFVVAEGGYILTNNHVVAGPGKLWVRVSGQKEVQADVIAADEKRDIALIKLQDPATASLKPLKISPNALAARRGSARSVIPWAIFSAAV